MIRSPYPDVEIPDATFTDFVLARAGALGDKPALIDAPSGRTITYAQLAESVRGVAAGLADRGFGKGDVFAHYAPNLPEYAVAFHAVATVGGVNTTANPLMTVEELATQLQDCGARLLVTVPALLERATAAAERAGVEEIFVYGEARGATPFASLLRSGGEPPEPAIEPAIDLVALPYSSGTTGLPKGVMLTHRNLVANICQITHDRLSEDEWEYHRVIAVLPFFHIYGLMSIMNASLYSGATVVTMPRFDLAEFLRVVQDYRITAAYVVPPIVLAMAKHPLIDEFDLSSLEFMLSGAAPLSAELEVACGKRLGCRMQQGYGMTETSPTTHFVTEDLAGQAPGSIGTLVPNTECRIVDVATGEDAPSGEPGEVCIRGPQVMKGYWEQPGETAKVLSSDGWLRTGDLGRIDEKGLVYIVDRKKDMILVSGFNVYPNEIEDTVMQNPGVAEVAAVGVPDEHSGEVVKLFVVRKDPNLTIEALKEFCRENLTGYKRPKLIEFRDELPKSNVGKILRRELRDEKKTAA